MQMDTISWIMNDSNEFKESKEVFWEFTLKLKSNLNFKINTKVKLKSVSNNKTNTISNFLDILTSRFDRHLQSEFPRKKFGSNKSFE